MKKSRGKRISIIGSEDFLGWRLALKLKEMGSIVTLSREAVSVADQVVEDEAGPPEGIIFLDHPVITDNDQIDEAFLEKQIGGLMKALRAASRSASYFLYASSTAVYGKQRYLPIDERHPLDPQSLYGAVKLAGENICRLMALENGFFYTILRFGDLYGQGRYCYGAPAVFMNSALEKDLIKIRGTGGQVRSYLYIEDAVDVIIKALKTKPANQVINAAANEYSSFWHLACMIKNSYAPSCRVVTGYRRDIPDNDVEVCIDSTRAAQLLGFEPVYDLKAGLEEIYRLISSGRSNRSTGGNNL